MSNPSVKEQKQADPRSSLANNPRWDVKFQARETPCLKKSKVKPSFLQTNAPEPTEAWP